MPFPFRRLVATSLAALLPLAVASQAVAQNATVSLNVQKQYIRGFGGMNHAAWAGDMTAAERTLAFGNEAGQLGLSVLRIPVTDGSPDAVNVATAKAALAAGAIVFATPWNAAGAMSSAQFSSYATHLNNFVTYMKNQGVNLYAISVQNEPDYGAEAGWGSWTAAQCHDFVLNYGKSITTKLISCESFNYAKSYYDPILNDAAALANLSILGTHLYGTPTNSYAYPLFDQKGGTVERWMTEHYTDSTTDANSWPNALGVASELHNSMVTGQFNLYAWWYIKRSYGFINSGAVTKRGWCIGHWSKFIRPGFYRVDATAAPTAGVNLSAYKGGSDVVIVVVNTNSAAKSLTVTVDGSSIASYDKFTTSSSKSMLNEGKVSVANGTLTLPLDASSVTTLRGTGTPTSSGGTTGSGGMTFAGGADSRAGAPNSGGAATGGAGKPGAGGGNGQSGAPGRGGASNSGGAATGSAGAPSNGGNGAGMASGGTENGGSGSGGVVALGGQSTASGGGASGGAPASSGGANSQTGGKGLASGGGAVDGSNESSDSGCSCRTATGARAQWLSTTPFLLGLVGLASRRRRRR